MILIFVEKANFEKLKEILMKDELVSRASISYKSASEFGKEGYYFLISGNEEQCKKAKGLSKDLGIEISGEEKERVIKKFKEEEEKALEGFGSILG
jgi:hypothetical protein